MAKDKKDKENNDEVYELIDIGVNSICLKSHKFNAKELIDMAKELLQDKTIKEYLAAAYCEQTKRHSLGIG